MWFLPERDIVFSNLHSVSLSIESGFPAILRRGDSNGVGNARGRVSVNHRRVLVPRGAREVVHVVSVAALVHRGRSGWRGGLQLGEVLAGVGLRGG